MKNQVVDNASINGFRIAERGLNRILSLTEMKTRECIRLPGRVDG